MTGIDTQRPGAGRAPAGSLGGVAACEVNWWVVFFDSCWPEVCYDMVKNDQIA